LKSLIDLMDFVDLMDSVRLEILIYPDFDYDDFHEVDEIHDVRRRWIDTGAPARPTRPPRTTSPRACHEDRLSTTLVALPIGGG
jgi:hypothetical protein